MTDESEYWKKKREEWAEQWEEWEREYEEYEKQREREWEEYERLWDRIIQLTKSFYDSIAEGAKDPQELDGFIDSMLEQLRKAGYAPPSD